MKEYLTKQKYFIGIFLVFLTVAIVSGIKMMEDTRSKIQDPNNNQIQNTNNTKQTTNDKTENKIDNDSIVQLDNDTTSLRQLATSSPSETIKPVINQDLPVTSYQLLVTSYELLATNTSTVFEVMQLASADSRAPFFFETKNFGGLGLFVEAINDLKNNLQTGEYWIYYINDESAKLGISQQTVKPNDIITWKYEKSNF